MDMIYWDHYYNTILLLNLGIVIALFTAVRFFSGTIAHIKATQELLTKDNPAFGISMAGAMFGVTVMLSGTVYGSPEEDMMSTILSVGVFGILGIVLMALTRLIFDKITLPAISLRDEIVKGNIAVAIADAANVLAAAIIIRTVMIWVTVSSVDGMMALFGGYVISQFILTAMTLVKRQMFSLAHKDTHLQEQLQKGNAAVALRLAGQKIGAAFALATAAEIVVYEEYEVLPILWGWLLASVIVLAAWKVVSFVAEKIILWRIDVPHEIVAQKNIAVGALLAVVYASMGLLISSL